MAEGKCEVCADYGRCPKYARGVSLSTSKRGSCRVDEDKVRLSGYIKLERIINSIFDPLTDPLVEAASRIGAASRFIKRFIYGAGI